MSYRLVILESPFAGNIELNIKYARLCMKDCFSKGEFPFASHLIYTQEGILNDNIPEERELGTRAGFAWAKHAEVSVIYTDLGITRGMKKGIDDALDNGRKVEYRKLENFNLNK